jgi:hypothetical protein
MKKNDAKQYLNLIVHGLCAFVEQDHHIDVIFPHMHEHTYAAGTWRQEYMLDPGEIYRLLGVTHAAKLPDECGECVISQRNSGISAIDPNGIGFCTLRVPLPKAMNPVRSMNKIEEASIDFFVGEAVDQNKLHPTKVPIIYGLQYEIQNRLELALSDFWTPNESELKQNFINLHVWAEPACNVESDHVSEGFRDLVGMLPGLDLAIHPKWDVDLPSEIEPFPPGVDDKEKAVLRERCGVAPVHLDVTNIRNCINMVVKK